MHAVVLAAGNGARLRPHTADQPKPLLKLNGRPIIAHVLDRLAEAGVDSATIVVGYRGDEIRRALAAEHPRGMHIGFAENPAHDRGNAGSVWAARAGVAGRPFVLAMADHIVDPRLLRTLLARANGRCALAVEFAAPGDARASEATLALVRGGLVRQLGKDIDKWNALDTGVFYCTPAVFDAITPDLREGELGRVFASLARAGALDAIDVTGCDWIDIDTAADLRRAAAMLAAADGAGVARAHGEVA